MTATMPVNLEGGPQGNQHTGWQDGAAPKWHIRHGFFTANGGVSTGLYQSLNCGFGSNDDPANASSIALDCALVRYRMANEV